MKFILCCRLNKEAPEYGSRGYNLLVRMTAILTEIAIETSANCQREINSGSLRITRMCYLEIKFAICKLNCDIYRG